jgi:hypothetical protein
MDLKVRYNKDKSRMQVTLTAKPAEFLWEQRVYNTAYIVDELHKKDIHVSKSQCIEPTKVFNYAGPKTLTGTWTFSLPKPQPTKSPTVTKEKVIKAKTTAKTTAKKTTKRV